MHPAATPAFVLAIVVLALAPTLASGAGSTDVAGDALAWLRAHRAPDGSFPDVATSHVVEALASRGADPRAWSSLDLGPQLDREADALRASEVPVRALHAWSVAGYETPALVAEARASYHDGTFGPLGSPAWDSFCILALRAAGVPWDDPMVQATAAHLASVRTAQGGWAPNFKATSAADVDTTGGVLAALAAAGVDVRGDARASLFLNSTHAKTGGHAVGITLGNGANTQSTMWALHAYRLLDVAPPADDEPWLLSQRQDDGSFLHDAAGSPNGWATAEAALYFTGGRYPLPGIVPFAFPHPHALESTTLALPDAYASARWTFPDGAAIDGTTVAHSFPSAGTYSIQVEARGPRAIHRGPTSITVLSARPVAVVPSEIETLRHTPVELDLGASYDPDGTVRGARVDWGDGNVTDAPGHAYDLPGERTIVVRVQDDAGEWSDPAAARVLVRNRAPILADVPARVVADRAHDVTFAPEATDPDGDAVEIDGPRVVRYQDLGERAVDFEAHDPYGGVATARAIVDVRNLPPTIAALEMPADARAERPFTLGLVAWDEDGPAPTVSWSVADRTLEGASVTLSLPAGAYLVAARATDADGDAAWAFGNLTILELGAPTPPAPADPPTATPTRAASAPPAEPLAPLAFDAAPASAIVGREARFALVPLADAVEYQFDLGDGNATAWSADTTAAHAWSRPGTYEVRATARAADGRESTASAIVSVAAPRAARPAPLSMERASVTSAAPVEAPATQPQAPAQPTIRTVPTAAPLLGLLLATLGRRRGRA